MVAKNYWRQRQGIDWMLNLTGLLEWLPNWTFFYGVFYLQILSLHITKPLITWGWSSVLTQEREIQAHLKILLAKDRCWHGNENTCLLRGGLCCHWVTLLFKKKPKHLHRTTSQTLWDIHILLLCMTVFLYLWEVSEVVSWDTLRYLKCTADLTSITLINLYRGCSVHNR